MIDYEKLIAQYSFGEVKDDTILKDYAAACKYCGMHIRGASLMQHGEIISEYYPENPASRRNQHSASKSVLSLAIGCAIEDGYLSLDTRVADIFPDKLPENPDPRLLKITVEHLLQMTAGFSANSARLWNIVATQRDCPDQVRIALAADMETEPGEKFCYNSGNPMLLSAMFTKLSGMTIEEYSNRRIFSKIGIPNVNWGITPDGHTTGGTELLLSVREQGIIGQLLLQGGVWNGEQVIPADYLKAATTPYTDASAGLIPIMPTENMVKLGKELGIQDLGAKDIPMHYGYQFWLDCFPKYHSAFNMLGAHNQNTHIIPELDAVFAVQAHFPVNYSYYIAHHLLTQKLVLDKLK